ncbi:MAG: hypothetical protein M0Q43_00620 [Methanothrix sp.]|jgi:hypothetical protein|uniref:hypothetical protein n=1 Tax=Methanothrix sp. TaxID=90426 RepID=UPI0025DBA1F2|nr:hypothetical protein [Methanothrix sp.]MCK9404989.1 hypothetical protein [Methanothrix sp.]MCK9564533.1 hypothetical protein [Methanothrix sp.]
MNEYDKTGREQRLPYGGLFGDSNLIKVIEQVIADPDIEYRPIDLEKLTKESAPTVRGSLKILTSLGLLKKDESDSQHPVYTVDIESKRYIALTMLAYAVLDDKNGTGTMDKAIADYLTSILRDAIQPRVYGIIETDIPKLAVHEHWNASEVEKKANVVYVVNAEDETATNAWQTLTDKSTIKDVQKTSLVNGGNRVAAA